MEEKRIKPRMHRRIPLSVELRFSGSIRGEGSILEMSEGGLSFATPAAGLATGSPIQISILDATGTLQLEATVVYGAVQDSGYLYGVQFGNITAKDHERVRGLLKQHRFRKFRNPLTPA